VVLLFAQRRSFAACCSALLAAAAHFAHQNCSSSSTAHISFDLDSLRLVKFSFFPQNERDAGDVADDTKQSSRCRSKQQSTAETIVLGESRGTTKEEAAIAEYGI